MWPNYYLSPTIYIRVYAPETRCIVPLRIFAKFSPTAVTMYLHYDEKEKAGRECEICKAKGDLANLMACSA